jgi:SAM-dependent methyltransferase
MNATHPEGATNAIAPVHSETVPTFDTADQRRLTVWNSLQRLQTDFCISQELSIYYTSPTWMSQVHSVLDVGTGNGYFLTRLARLFPDKRYIGLDSSEELIALARDTTDASAATFQVGDYFTASGRYDAVVMRLLWQHLETDRFDEALAVLTRITHPGSIVMISDAFDEVRAFTPDLPSLRDMISAYTARENAQGRTRSVAKRLLDWAHASQSWRVGSHLPLVIPSSIPGHLALFKQVYSLWIDLFESLELSGIDFIAARHELLRWSDSPVAYTQAGLNVIRLDRIA